MHLICLKNNGPTTSLEARKVYRAIPDHVALAKAFVRVNDESGEDYLYPANGFVPVEPPHHRTANAG